MEKSVGDRGLDAPASIASRAGPGAGALRTDAQRAALVDPSDRASARADCMNCQHRQPNEDGG